MNIESVTLYGLHVLLHPFAISCLAMWLILGLTFPLDENDIHRDQISVTREIVRLSEEKLDLLRTGGVASGGGTSKSNDKAASAIRSLRSILQGMSAGKNTARKSANSQEVRLLMIFLPANPGCEDLAAKNIVADGAGALILASRGSKRSMHS